MSVIVSTDPTYTFTATSDRHLTAVFEAIPQFLGFDWKQVTLPTETQWTDVAYGDGKFVAVTRMTGTYNQKVFYSIDGENWESQPVSFYGNVQRIVYGNGKFVCILNGSDKFYYSYDGLTWEDGTMPISSSWNSLAYGNGKFVAGTYYNSIGAYSEDGINWEQVSLPSMGYWYDIAYGDGKFIQVQNSSTKNAIVSDDGINWSEVEISHDYSYKWIGIVYGNGKFLALSQGGYGTSDRIAYSEDGVNWENSTLPSVKGWTSLAYGNGKFVVFSNSSVYAHSDDGINWEQDDFPSDITSADYSCCSYGNNKFVALAYNKDFAICSPG